MSSCVSGCTVLCTGRTTAAEFVYVDCQHGQSAVPILLDSVFLRTATSIGASFPVFGGEIIAVSSQAGLRTQYLDQSVEFSGYEYLNTEHILICTCA